MMGRGFGFGILIWGMILGLLGGTGYAAEWAQLQNGPAHSGYSQEGVATPYNMAWYRNFQPERVNRRVQAVTHRGKVIVPTEAGNVYALNEDDGEVAWKMNVGSPVEHTAACAASKAVVATLDGRVVALDIDSGRQVWCFEPTELICNYNQAPCIADSKVFIASRMGVLRAIGLESGKQVWERDFKVPIYQTAAYYGGKVYIGTEDIRMHAVDGSDGKEIWTSEQLYGQSFKDYHPVVTEKYVLVRSMPAHPSRRYFGSNWGRDPEKEKDAIFQATWGHYPYWSGYSDEDQKGQDVQSPYGKYYRQYVSQVRNGQMPKELMEAQEAVVEHYKENPYDQSFFVLERGSGKQMYIAPHFQCFSLPGPVCPPAIAADGTAVIPWIYASHVWAKFDLDRGRVCEIMLTPRYSNGDETINVSIGGDYLYVMHCEEANAAYTGIFNFESKQWASLPSVPKRWWQLSDNTESGNNAASISNGKFYHIVFHQIAAFTHDGSK